LVKCGDCAILIGLYPPSPVFMPVLNIKKQAKEKIAVNKFF